MTTRYAELAVTTNFSFLRGASSPEELVVAASLHGLDAIGIADRNTLAGVVRAYSALDHPDLPEKKPKLLVGARLAFIDGTPDIIAYPCDRQAYGRLCRILTKGKCLAKKGECHLGFADLAEQAEGLLLVLVPPPHMGEEITCALEKLKGVGAEGLWLAASMLYRGDDRRRLEKLKGIAFGARVPLLAINDVLYHAPERREMQDVVTCVREKVTIETAGRRLEANAERHLKAGAEMERLFRSAPGAIAETIKFADRVNFSLRELDYQYPDEPVPKGKTAQRHLEDLTWAGAKERYPVGIPPNVKKTLHKELRLIRQLDYARYFLTVHDIVSFANKKEILCQGRGSAANSAVCFMLGITAVSPSESKLLFARFLSKERREPPDIDVDFEHERREEVIQEIFTRYRPEHAAITATVISYRPRSAVRDVGKALGLTEDVTSALANTVWGSWGDGLSDSQIREAGLDPANPMLRKTIDLVTELIGFPRHLSQHVGGFVLTRDRLDEMVPIGNAAMDKRTFIEWDKDDIDHLRMMKVDVLALGMLTCIRKAFDLIKKHTGANLDLASIPRDDKAVYDMLKEGDSIGVFQVESRAQMNMLPRLRPENFYDLVIQVAIVRPGPIQGDMVHPYLQRRKDPSKVTFPSPSPDHGPRDELKQVLGRTLGVPLFQEQAMQLAIDAAKFTPDEANGLRRAMATFRNVGTIYKYKDMLVERMVARGYQRDFAERCFKQIEGFGSYGFPESHAASFARLVYISSWIKCHHPAAFAAALLNSQPMGFYAPAQIVRDAREHGVEVRAVDVSFSEKDNTLEERSDGSLALRLGFRQIDSFKDEWANAIAESRKGPFESFESFEAFAQAIGLPKRALMLLADADALRSLGLDRRMALWAVRRTPDDDPLPLFSARQTSDLASETTAPLPAMQLSEHVVADYQTIHLSLKGHPMHFLRAIFRGEGVSTCTEIANSPDGRRAHAAGVVLVRQRPGSAKGVVFMTIEDEGGIANVVIWPDVMERYRREVMGARLVAVEGRIQRSPEGVVHLVAERLFDRTTELRRLSEGELDRPVVPADEVVRRHAENGARRHPRNVRILPRSRDFH